MAVTASVGAHKGTRLRPVTQARHKLHSHGDRGNEEMFRVLMGGIIFLLQHRVNYQVAVQESYLLIVIAQQFDPLH